MFNMRIGTVLVQRTYYEVLDLTQNQQTFVHFSGQSISKNKSNVTNRRHTQYWVQGRVHNMIF